MAKKTLQQALLELKKEDYQFSVEVNGIGYDVYTLENEGKVGQVAFCMRGGVVEIPVIRVGRLSEEEMIAAIEDSLKENLEPL